MEIFDRNFDEEEVWGQKSTLLMPIQLENVDLIMSLKICCTFHGFKGPFCGQTEISKENAQFALDNLRWEEGTCKSEHFTVAAGHTPVF